MPLTAPVLIREDLPLLDKSEEMVVMGVRQALKTPGIVKMHIDAREDTMSIWRLATPEEAAERAVPFRDKLRVIQMEEFIPLEEQDPLAQLFDMFEMIDDAGCVPCFILSGRPLISLRKWIPISRKASSLFGSPLLFEESLEEDVLVICGAKTHEAEVSDILYGVKVTLP